MLESENSLIEEFGDSVQFVASAIEKYLSAQLKSQQFVINPKLLMFNESALVSMINNNSNCIQMEEFLKLCTQRWKKEVEYQHEIFHLKDLIIEEFTNFCDGIQDESLIDLIREQRQEIIEALFEKIKFDQKQIAADFCKALTNGFEVEALKKLDNVAYYVLCKHVMGIIPVGLVDFIKQIFQTINSNKTIETIKETTLKIINYINSYLEVKEIDDSKFKSAEEFKKFCEKKTTQRKSFVFFVKEMKNYYNIINEYLPKCIESIGIKGNAVQWITQEYPTVPEGLKVYGTNNSTRFLNILNTVGTKLTSLCLKVSNIKQFDLEWMQAQFSRLIFLKKVELDFSNNEIKYENAALIGNSISGLKTILILILSFHQTNFGDKEIAQICSALSQPKHLLELSLNFSQNNFGVLGVESISGAIKELKNLSKLYLNLSNNKIESEGMKFLSKSLRELNQLQKLNLNLKNNKIGSIGANYLAKSLRKFKNIIHLNVNLYWNNIRNKGGIEIASAVRELKNLLKLSLNLGANSIELEGAVVILPLLKELRKVSKLDLNLIYNWIHDSGIISIGDSLTSLTNISSLNLNLSSNNIEDKGFASILETIQKMPHIANLALGMNENKFGNETSKPLIHYVNQAIATKKLNFKISIGWMSENKIEEILKNLQHLENITTLDLNLKDPKIVENAFFSVSNIVKDSQKTTSVTLVLRDIFKTVEEAEALSACLEKWEKITDLNLCLHEYNKSDTIIDLVLNRIKELNNIKKLGLNLSWARNSSNNFKFVPKCFHNLQNIAQVAFNSIGNQISDNEIDDLANALTTLPNILDLNLNIETPTKSVKYVKTIAHCLQNLIFLNKLTLNFNNQSFNDTEIKQIANALSKPSNLFDLKLNLNNCGIYHQQLKLLAAALNQLKTLLYLKLDLRNNSISNESEEFFQKLEQMVPSCEFLVQIHKN